MGLGPIKSVIYVPKKISLLNFWSKAIKRNNVGHIQRILAFHDFTIHYSRKFMIFSGINFMNSSQIHYFFSGINFMHCWYMRNHVKLLHVQQGLEIHGLEEHGPWRYTVFNWIPKHLRYTVLGQKPWRCTFFLEIHGFWPKALKVHGF